MDEPRPEPPARDAQGESPESGRQLSLWPPEPPASASETEALIPGNREEDHAAALPIPPLPEPPWSLADLGAFILFAFFSFIFANVAGVFIFSAMQRSFSWRVSLERALTQTPWVVLMQTGWELLWLVFIYLTVSKKYHRRFWEALKWVRAPGQPAAYLLAGAGLAIGAQLVVNVFPSNKHLPVEKLFTSTGSAYLLAFFGICIAPFIEEMVFRGFFYPVFERLWGLAVAVLLTGLLFAAIHVPQLSGGWEEITSIFIVGMVFSYCRGKTGSLVASFLMHIAYNTSLFVSLYFSTDHFRNFKG
jgi:membrane protease YdiL (CAAX protease family)